MLYYIEDDLTIKGVFLTINMIKRKNSVVYPECLRNCLLDVMVIFRLLLCPAGGLNPVAIESKPG